MIGTYPLIVGKDGILERVKRTLQIYFLCRHVEKISKKTDQEHVVRPTSSEVMESYRKIHRFTSKRELRMIFGLAVQWKYMKEIKEEDRILVGVKVLKIELLEKGSKIIDTFPFIPIPTGLIDALYKEGNVPIKIMATLIPGGIGVAIWQLLKISYQAIF